MKCRIEDVRSVEKKMYIEVSRETVDAEFENAYKELNKKVKLKGFRAGKVPRHVLESVYRQQVEHDILNKLLNDSYPKALEEANIKPVAKPVISEEQFKAGSDLKYTATVEVKPVIEVKDYLELEIEKEEPVVTEADVEKKIQEIRTIHAQLKTVDEERGLEKGDVAIIDYEGSVDGEPLEGSSGRNYHLEIGSGLFNPDFENQLIGLRKDAETEIKVTFSDNFANEKMAGKTVTFKVNVKDLKEKVLPELDDAFAADLGAGFKNLEDLRNRVKETMVENARKQAEASVRKQILDQLIEKHQFELPPSLVEAEIEDMLKQTRHNLERKGISAESMGISDEAIKTRFKEEAEKRVKGQLILEQIAEKENIRVEEKDIDEQFDKVAAQMNMGPEDAQRLRMNPNLMESLPDYVLPEKTLNYLIEHAKIKLN